MQSQNRITLQVAGILPGQGDGQGGIDSLGGVR